MPIGRTPNELESNDPETFGSLVWESRVDLYAYLARRAPEAAEDLLSEVWVSAYRSQDTFDPARGSVRVWLFGIARNVLNRHLGQRAKDDRPWRWRQRESDGDSWHLVDARLDAAAVAPALREALRDLAPEERELLLLVAWENLMPTEAAAVLSIPPGTARSRLHRARLKVIESLRERFGPNFASTQ